MAVAKLLDIIVHDHVIVDVHTNDYYSFCDKGIWAGLETQASKIIEQF